MEYWFRGFGLRSDESFILGLSPAHKNFSAFLFGSLGDNIRDKYFFAKVLFLVTDYTTQGCRGVKPRRIQRLGPVSTSYQESLQLSVNPFGFGLRLLSIHESRLI